MTAAVFHGRENVKIERVRIPSIGEDDVLVRVHVALTCGTDLKVWRQGFHERMIKPPAVFGHELAGVVEEVGGALTGVVRKGMRVVPANSAPCETCFYCRKGQPNLCEDLLFNNGAYAEYIRIPGRIARQNMLEIPEGVAFKDAALVEPIACVLRGIHETNVQPGDTIVVIGCGPIGLGFVRMLTVRGARVIAIGKRPSQMAAAERLGAVATFDVAQFQNPVNLVRELTENGRGADAVIEAVGRAETWQWAFAMVRKGGTVQLFGGCPRGTEVKIDPATLHYSEVTLKSSFHHTPRFIREALAAVVRGEVCAADFVTGEAPLAELPGVFRRMSHRNGELKTAIIP
ncbi:MAG: alcohol dehydrogenase catalytic domain-containing protein [Acidobacteriota bacterium]|nr:alcohol dehydrogenase catalytic domain-containing protein [Acidobacteriota bacterium]MDE3168593.1 alcohol dehydrogenase catalytic domain-containing protein [Acidobacteriota bacterium]